MSSSIREIKVIENENYRYIKLSSQLKYHPSETSEEIQVPKTHKKVRFVVISDTHQLHDYLPPLPEADFLLHCGDFTNFGTIFEAMKFNAWLGKQTQFKHKIIIAGNHENIPDLLRPCMTNCNYLLDQSITIDGISFYGSRFKPFWSSIRMNDKLAKQVFNLPEHIDILLTHQPPLYHGFDEGRGNKVLRDEIEKIKPIVHLHGHIHDLDLCYSNRFSTTFINAASVIGSKKHKKLRLPIVFDLVISINGKTYNNSLNTIINSK